ncbi:hypothetical protein [Frondihabitans sucicola]|uniref:hypothetical protein n=1 Tax=Frondihabitans sucicola TaxID=1268041 RepID=UPI00257461A4|nr:hypothetical protein [Frondihabitans sucicola]
MDDSNAAPDAIARHFASPEFFGLDRSASERAAEAAPTGPAPTATQRTYCD